MNIIINSIFSKDSILKPLYKSKVTFAKYMFFTVICFSFFGVFTSCQTLKPSRQIIISRKIADTGFLSSSQLAAFFMQENPSYNKKDIQKLERGVRVENYISAPSKIEKVKINSNKYTSSMNITIHEGKNREIKVNFYGLLHFDMCCVLK